MKKSLLFFFLILFFNYSFSQVQQSKNPDWVLKKTYDTEPEINYNEISQGVLLLMDDRQINVDKEHQFTHRAIKILDNIGIQEASSINITFDPTFEKIYFHEIMIFRDGIKINKLELSKFNVIQRELNAESHVYDGSLSAIMNLSDIRKGDIIEISYSRIGANPIHQGAFSNMFYLNDFEPVGKISLRILSRDSLQLTHRNATIKPKISKNQDQIEYVWNKTNINSEELEDNIPIWANPLESVFVSDYNSWDEVVKWGVKVFDVGEISNKNLLQKIAEIDKNYKSNGEKTEAVLNFVQDEVRYLGLESGIGAYKPFSPDKVFEQRYGDCKDKSLLMSKMLQKMDIQAYPMLVNTGLMDELKNINPSPILFDHCVVRADIDGSQFYYDPTISNQGGSYKSTFFPNYKTGLVLRKGNTELEEIYHFSSGRVEVFEEFEIDSAWSGAKMKIITKYYENEADHMRKFFMGSSINTIQREYINYYSNYFYKIEFLEDIKTKDDLKENIFIVTSNMKIDSLFTPEVDNKKISSASFHPTNIYEVLIFPNKINRKNPFNLYYPTTREHQIKIKLPEQIQINKENDVINGKGFYYKYDYTYNDKTNELNLNYLYKSQNDHVTVDDFENYFNQINVLNNIIGYSIQHENTIATNNYSFAKVLNILIILASLFFFIWLAVKLYNYNPIPRVENYFEKDKAIGGWLILLAIALIISPIYFAVTIITDDIIINGEWLQFLNSSSLSYNIGFGLIIFIEFLINVGFLVFYTLAVFLFFKKRSSFPKVFIFLLISNTVFIILDSLIVFYLDTSAVDEKEIIKEIFYAIIRVGIWVPYFLISERAKQTFVQQLTPIKIKDNPGLISQS
ncbi:MAG: DUF3857 domain-containing protein [Bacteroidota bacterium]